MDAGILQLAIVISIAAVLGVIAKMLKQPLVLAYLATGIMIGYSGMLYIANGETFRVFSDLGIMFLLFLVGIEINYTSLRLVGKTSFLLGLGQVLLFFIPAWLVARLFGFTAIEAVYLGLSLAFSSTVIVVKLLSDKKDATSLYGRITVGILLAQDLIAIIVLVLLAGVRMGEGVSFGGVSLVLLKVFLLGALMMALSTHIFPPVFNRIARYQELQFIISLAWVFALAAVVSRLGFSIEIAGFLAGLALANSAAQVQIANRMRSLRDFFLLIFFVILGSSFVFSNFSGLLWPIIVFSLLVIVGTPLIMLVLMGWAGFRKRTSFMVGVTLAQVSEFSLILMVLGERLGQVGQGAVSVITATAIVTIVVSSYIITHANGLYLWLSPWLSMFERRTVQEEENTAIAPKEIILIGCHRTGRGILQHLSKNEVLVVDFDPDVIVWLGQKGYAHLYGDAADHELFDQVPFDQARLVISTSPDVEDNLSLIYKLAQLPKTKRPKIVARAKTEKEAELLYAAGADYAMLSHLSAGHYLGKDIANDRKLGILKELKTRDLAILSEGKAL